MAMEVRPFLAFSSAACTTASLAASRALVASSSSNIGGSRTNARQIATRCFWPPDSLLPRGPTGMSQPCPIEESMKLRFAMSLHSVSLCSEMLSPSVRPYTTFSRTVVLKRIGSWPTKPICCRHHRMFRSASVMPDLPTSTRPCTGS
mmetsp:Transcript_60673/g.116955  ORF Transcript_60673/g.116955 Transcript_60673/m.116955 type:complete len:147 (-) Transcript_60673:525-965(-)